MINICKTGLVFLILLHQLSSADNYFYNIDPNDVILVANLLANLNEIYKILETNNGEYLYHDCGHQQNKEIKDRNDCTTLFSEVYAKFDTPSIKYDINTYKDSQASHLPSLYTFISANINLFTKIKTNVESHNKKEKSPTDIIDDNTYNEMCTAFLSLKDIMQYLESSRSSITLTVKQLNKGLNDALSYHPRNCGVKRCTGKNPDRNQLDTISFVSSNYGNYLTNLRMVKNSYKDNCTIESGGKKLERYVSKLKPAPEYNFGPVALEDKELSNFITNMSRCDLLVYDKGLSTPVIELIVVQSSRSII